MAPIPLPDLPKEKTVVSILSGGLDSTVLTHWLVRTYGAERVLALTFNYAQRHAIELEKAARTVGLLGIEHQLIDISFLGSIISKVSALSAEGSVATPNIKEILGMPQPVTYVPYRNLILLSLGLSFAESNNAAFVFTGLQTTDEYSYWDTSEPFVNGLNVISNLNREHDIRIVAPFARLSKADEIAIGQDLGVDFADTWTCYNPVEGELSKEKLACGVCPSCSERIGNFRKAHTRDPLPYNIPLDWDQLLSPLAQNS